MKHVEAYRGFLERCLWERAFSGSELFVGAESSELYSASTFQLFSTIRLRRGLGLFHLFWGQPAAAQGFV